MPVESAHGNVLWAEGIELELDPCRTPAPDAVDSAAGRPPDALFRSNGSDVVPPGWRVAWEHSCGRSPELRGVAGAR
jgi:hypothetical protein